VNAAYARHAARALLALVACAGASTAVGCSSSGSASTAADAAAGDDVEDLDGGAGVDDAPRLPTFSAVYAQVLEPNCALPFCHAGTGDYLQLPSMAGAYASLVDASAQGPDCVKTGLKRVDPGHPDASLLYLKITNPPCGSKMPLYYDNSGMLQPADIDQIEQWILQGAQNN
jgi:hypothetical protein